MMPRKPKKPTDKTLTTVELPAPDLVQATGTNNEHLQLQRLRSVLNALWLPGSDDQKAQSKAIAGVLAALKKIAPADELEGMLAAQMVATHNTAMECLRRAHLPEQSFEGRQDYLKQAARFLGLYTRQIEAFDKHRGKGQQKITVEHVQVHSGGKAIVGHVNARDGDAVGTGSKSLEHKPASAMPPPQKALTGTRGTADKVDR